MASAISRSLSPAAMILWLSCATDVATAPPVNPVTFQRRDGDIAVLAVPFQHAKLGIYGGRLKQPVFGGNLFPQVAGEHLGGDHFQHIGHPAAPAAADRQV